MNTISSAVTVINSSELPKGYVLSNYVIERKLGHGGFGITYLARETATNRAVVIKENFPRECSQRHTTNLMVGPSSAEDKGLYEWALTRFLDEAKVLIRLSHPGIVPVLTAFRALGTAYYVMPRVEGKEIHKAAPSPQTINEAWLRPVLQKLLEALDYLHGEGLLHRDIKPSNILMCADTSPLLIDFGTARSSDATHTLTRMGTPGFSPSEQFLARGKNGPWTDLYSLGATCYYLITGEVPQDSMERLAEDELLPLAGRKELHGRFSAEFLSAIDKALCVSYKNRWQCAQEWMNHLSAAQRAREEVERRKKEEARQQAERKASEAHAQSARALAEQRAREEAEEKVRRMMEEREAKERAEQRAREEAEEKVRRMMEERKARERAEQRAREEAEEKVRRMMEERKTRERAEQRAREEAEEKVRRMMEERKTRERAEQRAREEAEEKVRRTMEERKARERAGQRAREEAEDKVRRTMDKRKAREPSEQKVDWVALITAGVLVGMIFAEIEIWRNSGGNYVLEAAGTGIIIGLFIEGRWGVIRRREELREFIVATTYFPLIFGVIAGILAGLYCFVFGVDFDLECVKGVGAVVIFFYVLGLFFYLMVSICDSSS